jgi:hypothetical protein
MKRSRWRSFASTRRHLWLTVGLLLACGCGKREGGKSAGGAGATSPAAQANTQHVFQLTPEAYYSEYQANSDSIHEKYRNGVVEIAGTVDEVSVNLAGDSTVNLRAGSVRDAQGTLPVVICVTTNPEPWGKLARGQTTTFRGDVGFPPFGPNLKSCDIVSTGPSTALTVWPFQLASEYGSDKATFKKTYAGKNLIVSGKVLEIKKDSAGAVSFRMEGVGDIKVWCDFGMIESIIKTVVPGVAVGQKVHVFGEVTAFDKPDLTITSCHLITK